MVLAFLVEDFKKFAQNHAKKNFITANVIFKNNQGPLLIAVITKIPPIDRKSLGSLVWKILQLQLPWLRSYLMFCFKTIQKIYTTSHPVLDAYPKKSLGIRAHPE